MKTSPKIDLTTVTVDHISRVYSGLPGCGCGCRGKYSENKGAKTRILNELKKRITEVEQNMFSDCKDDAVTVCFALEDDVRYRWAYVNLTKLVNQKG